MRLRNLTGIMLSRGIDVSHQTIARCVNTIDPELGKQVMLDLLHRKKLVLLDPKHEIKEICRSNKISDYEI